MELLKELESAKTYPEISEIISKHLSCMKDVNSIKYSSVKTNFLTNQGVRFHACVLGENRYIDHMAAHDVLKTLEGLKCNIVFGKDTDPNADCKIQCVPGVFKVDNQDALYVHLDIDAAYVPLVIPLIENAKKVRKKQIRNMQVNDEAELKGRELVKGDEMLKQLNKRVSARKKTLNDKAKKIKEDYRKANTQTFTEEEQKMFAEAGEAMNLISLW
jgi:hypothetical protein